MEPRKPSGTGDATINGVLRDNGVENERLASRWFADVYGLYVYIYALSIEPGLVQCLYAFYEALRTQVPAVPTP